MRCDIVHNVCILLCYRNVQPQPHEPCEPGRLAHMLALAICIIVDSAYDKVFLQLRMASAMSCDTALLVRSSLLKRGV
jgi:hypothetical protein